MKIALLVIEFAFAGAGVGLGFYHDARFTALAVHGSAIRDALHVVLLNKHGSYTYITLKQSEYLQHILYTGGALLTAAVLIEVGRRWFDNGPKRAS